MTLFSGLLREKDSLTEVHIFSEHPAHRRARMSEMLSRVWIVRDVTDCTLTI